jgi:glycine/D-amino acid oxidase-like deaminating enzyme
MRGAPPSPADRHSPTEHFYRSRSLWLDVLPLARRPRLGGNATCDVAVVGAGFTGLWTAYYLKRQQPDLRVVIIEREIAGFGPSGRNGGWVSGGIAGGWRIFMEQRGRPAVLRAEQATFCAVDEIGAVVEREKIACGFTKRGMVSIATNGPQAARLRTDLEAAYVRGLQTEDLDETLANELGLPCSHCRFALFSPHCASLVIGVHVIRWRRVCPG